MQTEIMGYIQAIETALIVGLIGLAVRLALKKIEELVAAHTAPDKAQKINELLETIERLVEAAVQDANSRIVSDLKKNNLFTKETGSAVKAAIIQDIINSLDSLKDEAALLGSLEDVIGKIVEKHVLEAKNKDYPKAQ